MGGPTESGGSRRLACFVALAVLVAVAAGTPAQPVQAAQVGVVGDITWGQPQADVDREVALMQAMGARWVRANVNWRYLEPHGRGQIDRKTLAEYDYAVDKARAAGIEVLMPIADGVPYWASSDPGKHVDTGGENVWNAVYPPSDMGDFAAFTRFVVNHYKRKGVHAYEIWNEPNIPVFWQPEPNAAQYTEMLNAAYPAVKKADPKATVVLGGLSTSDYRYLEEIYAGGGGRYFDAVAVHPYTYGEPPSATKQGENGDDPNRISPDSFAAIKEIRATMERFGDSHKNVWITEFGYTTTSQGGGITPEQQADYLVDAYSYVERLPWVHSMFTYQIRNNPFHDDADDYEGQFGLVTTAWDEKPALSAMEAYSAVMRARNSARRKRRGEQVDEPFFALGQSFAHIPPTGGNGY